MSQIADQNYREQNTWREFPHEPDHRCPIVLVEASAQKEDQVRRVYHRSA